MTTLSTKHRRQLERTVVEARDIAEAGARAGLEGLAVRHHEPYGDMSGEQRRLRNRLRAHARHLGEWVDARTGSHTIDHLVQECAYEQWHGMLFARFLAENHLLIEPEMGVAITLDECEELAKKDRGKEPTRDQGQFTWYWENGKFTGDRVNNVHLANAEKRAAPEAAGSAAKR